MVGGNHNGAPKGSSAGAKWRRSESDGEHSRHAEITFTDNGVRSERSERSGGNSEKKKREEKEKNCALQMLLANFN
jgi:hypothetical protein